MDKRFTFPLVRGFFSDNSQIRYLLVLVAAYLMGVSLCVFALYSEVQVSGGSAVFDTVSQPASRHIPLAFLMLGWSHFLTLIFGSSRFGFCLIPCLSLVRGFCLAALNCVLVIEFERFQNEAYLLLVSSFFSVVSFILLAEECMGSSYALQCVARGISKNRLPLISTRVIISSAALLIMAALTRQLMISF